MGTSVAYSYTLSWRGNAVGVMVAGVPATPHWQHVTHTFSTRLLTVSHTMATRMHGAQVRLVAVTDEHNVNTIVFQGDGMY